MEENVTLVGYQSKKQQYVFLAVSVAIFIVAILWCIFVEANSKYASIAIALIAIGFLVGFFQERKNPKVALKVFHDKFIVFYSSYGEEKIDFDDVAQVNYWPANSGLKITFLTHQGNGMYFSCLLANAQQVKERLLELFDKRGIPVAKEYTAQ